MRNEKKGDQPNGFTKDPGFLQLPRRRDTGPRVSNVPIVNHRSNTEPKVSLEKFKNT